MLLSKILILICLISATAFAGVPGAANTVGVAINSTATNSFCPGGSSTTCFSAQLAGSSFTGGAHILYKDGSIYTPSGSKNGYVFAVCYIDTVSQDKTGQLLQSSSSFSDGAATTGMSFEFGADEKYGHFVSSAYTGYCDSEMYKVSNGHYLGWETPSAGSLHIIVWIQEI